VRLSGWFTVVGTCVLAALAPRAASAQHITIDGRFSPAQTLVGPNYTIGANLGKQVGSNLFHSFGQFNLSNTPVPESATFTSTGSTGPISNVIGRVTGGNQSSINGAIISAIPGANLYLINPSGIVFGPHATINVSGSVHASTADYLKMSDGAKFQATNADASTLSAAPPVAFGFLTATPAQISVNGSTLGPVPGTLGLVGGPVSISGGTLAAPAGTIHVTSAAGTGEVPVDPRNKSALTVTSFGPVAVTGGSTLNVSDPVNLGSGGSVFIRSGALTIDASEINADNYGSGQGGTLFLRGDAQLALSDSAYVHSLAQASGSGAAVILHSATGGTLTADNSIVAVGSNGAGNSGKLVVTGGQISLTNGAQFMSTAQSAGNGGTIAINANSLVIDSGASVASTTAGTGLSDANGNPASAGAGGAITITAQNLTMQNGGNVVAQSLGDGAGGAVLVAIASALAIDESSASFSAGILTLASGPGNAGAVAVTAGSLSILSNGEVASTTIGLGNAGNVSVNVAGSLLIDGRLAPEVYTGITSLSTLPDPERGGDAGAVTVVAGSATILNSGVIASGSLGAGNGGPISVNVTGALSLDGGLGLPSSDFSSGTATMGGRIGGTGIISGSLGSGNGGPVTISAGTLSVANDGVISSGSLGDGNGGSVFVNVAGAVVIDGAFAPILPGVPTLTGVSTGAVGSGNGGVLTLHAGTLTIANNGMITSGSVGGGQGGSITVDVAGTLLIGGASAPNTQQLTGISSASYHGSSGNAGTVSVTAGRLSILSGGEITSGTSGSGNGGNVSVGVAEQLTIDATSANTSFLTGISAEAAPGSTGNAGAVNVSAGGILVVNGGAISSATAGPGNGGVVQVSTQGPLSLAGPGSGIFASATSTASGNAGSVTVSAPQITVASGAGIASTTAGTGAGGSVNVMTPGALVLDGMGVSNTLIAASATGPQSGPGGAVMVQAGTLTVEGGAQIASTTIGPGAGGDISVTIANGVNLMGTGPNGGSGITASAQPGSSGRAGEVLLAAGGAIALSGGAQIASSSAGAGGGGSVQVAAQGPLTLSDPGTGIIAPAASTVSANAGSVTVNAPQITLSSGAEISSIMQGSGGVGSVSVMTPGALVLDGEGIVNTRIAASATGAQSGAGGVVTVEAGSLTVQGGAQIASTAGGLGKGGDVDVKVVSDIVLLDPGSQITAMSTGSGDAGSVTVSAFRVVLGNGAAVSTEAETSKASGGNITLKVGDILYLKNGEISTSVKGETGNGGNITIDPQTVVLDRSSIIAQAIEGHGGNITINANEYLQSADSVVSATSALGISGTIEIIGPRVDLNGALVVLSSELRSAAQVLRNSCAAQAGLPQSSLVEGGRGGLPQDPDATLPALYIAGRNMSPASPAVPGPPPPIPAQQTTARLTMHCG
jgi:filamentous hemagglutinin family protein